MRMAKELTIEEEVIKLVQKILNVDKTVPEEAREPILTLFKWAYLDDEIDESVLGKWTTLGFVKDGQFGVNLEQLEIQIPFMALAWSAGWKAEMVEA